MARLPVPGSDDDVWGLILNDFLDIAHNADGTLQTSALEQAGGITKVNGVTASSGGAITLTAADIGAPTALASDSDVSITTPTNSQVLTYNGNKWVNQSSAGGPPSGNAAGDLSGSYPNPTVARVNGISVSGTPSTGQVITATSSSTADWATTTGTIDWINAVAQYGADNTGVTDATTALQNAINAANEGQVVYLPRGTYITSKPLVIQKSVVLRGSRGATGSGDDASNDYGSIIRPSNAWSNPSYSAYASAVILFLDQTPGSGGNTLGGAVRDLWVDGSNSPSNVDGFASYGPVSAIRLDAVGIYKATGRGFALYLDSGASSSAFPDGWHLNNCLAQNCGSDGFYGYFVDSTAVDCHAQSNGGDGLVIKGANNRWLGFRSDLNNNGFTIDVPGGGGYEDANTFIGCGTQRNQYNGMNVINSSSAGNSKRAPVVITGCMFSEDGANNGAGGGGYAGIAISGNNLVTVDATNVTVGTVDVAAGCPQYGITTGATGTLPGVPASVRMTSGMINYASSGAAFNNAAPATDFNISPMVVTYAGYQPGQITQPFIANVSAASLNVQAAVNSRGGLINIVQEQSSPSNPGLNFTGQNASDVAFGMLIPTDTFSRYRLDVSGSMAWGPGTSEPDVQLTRTSVSQLEMSDAGSGNSPQFKIFTTVSNSTNPLIQIQNNASGDLAYNVLVAGDTSSRFRVDSNGKIEWGPGNATQDTDLYRSAVNTLTTDGSFVAGTDISAPWLTSSGLGGATAASRYVGATASGPPVSGTFLTGDFLVDQTGNVWVCTAGGSPGTWRTTSVGAPLSLSASQSAGQILTLTNTTSTPSNSNLEIVSESAGDKSFGIEVNGDSSNRLNIDSNGKLSWGSGATAQDLDLYRASAGMLQTDNSLTVSGSLVRGTSAGITAEVDVINTVSSTPIISLALPTGILQAGTTFRISARGTIQVAATSGALTFTPSLAGQAASQVLQMPSQTSAGGPVAFYLEYFIQIRTTGGTGTYIAWGDGELEFSSRVNLDNSGLATTAINTATTTPVIQLTAQWATGNASNALKVAIATIEQVV